MKQIVVLIVAIIGNNFLYAQMTIPAGDSAGRKPRVDSGVIKPKPSAGIFPNPAKNKVSVSVRNFEPGFVQVRLSDLNGNKIREESRLLLSGNEVIVMMFALSPGIYFITLKQKGNLLRQKLLVQ